jgi:hypothetical protein
LETAFLPLAIRDSTRVSLGVRKAVSDRQNALTDLVPAVREYPRLADSTPLTLQGSEYAHAVQELNKAIDRADALCSNDFPSDAMQNLSLSSEMCGQSFSPAVKQIHCSR